MNTCIFYAFRLSNKPGLSVLLSFGAASANHERLQPRTTLNVVPFTLFDITCGINIRLVTETFGIRYSSSIATKSHRFCRQENDDSMEGV